MADVAQLKARFSAEGVDSVVSGANRVDRALENTAEHGNRMGKALLFAGGAVTGAFGAAAIGGVARFAGGLLTLNANAETMRNSLNVAMGSVSRAGEEFVKLQKFAAATPFEFPELVQTAIELESLGVNADKYMTTIGDTSAATGKSLEQTTQAFLDAGVGQYERLKDFGIQASVNGDMLTLSYMKNGEKITKTVDRTNQTVVDDTLQAIWNEKYAGAMATQSKTFNGMFSTLKDNIHLHLMAMTNGIFEFAKGGLKAANQFFTRFDRYRAEGFTPMQAATRAIEVGLRKAFGDGAVSMFHKFTSVIHGTVEALKLAFKVMSYLSIPGLLIHAMIGNWFGLRDAVVGAGKAIFDAVGTVAKSVGGLAHMFMRTLKSGDIIGKQFKALPGFMKPAAFAILSVADSVHNLINAFDKNGLQGVFDRLPTELGNLGSAFGALGGQVGGAVIDAAVSIGSWVIDTAVDIGPKIVDFLAATAVKLAGVAVNIGSWVISTVPDLGLDLVRFLAATGVKLAGVAVSIGSWIINTVPDLGLDLVRFLAATGVTLAAAAVSIGSWVITTAEDIGPDIVRFLAATSVTLSAALVSVGSWVIGTASDIGPTLSAWFDAHTPTINVKANAIVTFGSVTVPNFAAQFVRWIMGLDTQSWGQAFGQKLQTMDWSSAATAMFNGLVAALNTHVGIALVFFISLPALLVGAMIGISALMSIKAGEFILGFIDGLTQGWSSSITPWLASRPARVVTEIGVVTATLLQTGVDLITGLQAGIDQKYAGIVAWLRALPADVVSEIGDVTVTLMQTGVDLIQGFWNGLTAQWAFVSEWFSSRPEESVLEIGDVSVTLWDTGVQLIAGLWNGASEQWDSFTGWLAGLGTSIQNWVGNLGDVLYGAGQDAIAGLAAGAESQIPYLQSVLNTATNLFNAIRALGHSPWPMMIEAGQDAIDGLIVGVQNRHRTLAKTVGGASDTMLGLSGSPVTGYSSVTRSHAATPWQSGAVPWPHGAGGVVHNHYYLDGAILGPAATRWIQDEIASGAAKPVNRAMTARQMAGARA